MFQLKIEFETHFTIVLLLKNNIKNNNNLLEETNYSKMFTHGKIMS